MGERPVLGLTQDILILGNNQETTKVKARVDTGATSSSLDKRLAQKLALGPAIRMKVVKSASGIEERPIVKAKVEINGIRVEAEFSIADRNHMTYEALIGQNILKQGEFIIDPLQD